MNNKNKKRMFRYFTIADFEKEEIFLRKQHKQGWKLIKFTFPGIYTFESCQPEDVIYQLDFSDIENADKPSYLNMFADYGWEYLFDVNGFSYFRKSVISQNTNDLNIFSDTSSKLNMIRKIISKRLFPLIIIFLLIIIPQIIHQSYANKTMLTIFIFLAILYMILFIHLGISFYNLKKKHN